MEVDEEQIYIQHFAWGFCRLDGLAAWIHWSNIDEFVREVKSIAELCPSPHWELTVRTLANCPRRRICLDNSNTSK
jgi:hypothetical protein